VALTHVSAEVQFATAVHAVQTRLVVAVHEVLSYWPDEHVAAHGRHADPSAVLL
jgi:hypothetical protein